MASLKPKQIWLWLLIILVVGGMGGVLLERAVLPYLASLPILENFIPVSPQSPIVINRREEIQIVEGLNYREVSDRVRETLVMVYLHEGEFGARNFRLQQTLSGVVMTSDGVIAVPLLSVSSGTRITALLSDGQAYPAELLASDALTGLSFVKISKNNLPVIRPGTAQQLPPGERVLALWKAEGTQRLALFPLVTTSRAVPATSLSRLYELSRLNSFLPVGSDLSNVNLGAVIADREGLMIGLVSQTGREVNVLRAEEVRAALSNLLDDGQIVWPELLLTYLVLDKAQAQLLEAGESYGILVRSGPSPLRENDFIYAVDGRPLTETEGFQEAILARKPGESITLRFLRASVEQELEIDL